MTGSGVLEIFPDLKSKNQKNQCLVWVVAPVALVEDRPSREGLRSAPRNHSAAFAEASSCQGDLRSGSRSLDSGCVLSATDTRRQTQTFICSIDPIEQIMSSLREYCKKLVGACRLRQSADFAIVF